MNKNDNNPVTVTGVNNNLSLPFTRMVFSRHLYYVNYSQYGCDIQFYNMVSRTWLNFMAKKLEFSMSEA